jgi:hypothetical protein
MHHTDSKSSEHHQQTPGRKSASAGPVLVPKCNMVDLRPVGGSIRNPKVTQQAVSRGHTQVKHRSQRVKPIAGPGFGIECVVPCGERDFLAWTEKLHLLSLYNHDLPKAVGFVESYRRYMLARLSNISVQSRVAAPVLSFVILHSPKSSMASTRRDDIARRNTREQQDSDSCIRIARDSS